MKKKICLTLVVCLILSVMAGCGSKKPFGMEIEDLRSKLNDNIKALGYDLTVPEFDIQYGTETVINEKSKVNKDKEYYVSHINDYCILAIYPPEEMIGSTVILTINPHTKEEFAEMLPDLVAIASSIIVTVDPKADMQEVLDNLKLTSSEQSEKMTFKTNAFTYKSDTGSLYKSFIIEQYPLL